MRRKQKRLAASLGALATAVLAAFAQPALAHSHYVPCDWLMCSNSCYSGQCDLECTNECYLNGICYNTYTTGCELDE